MRTDYISRQCAGTLRNIAELVLTLGRCLLEAEHFCPTRVIAAKVAQRARINCSKYKDAAVGSQRRFARVPWAWQLSQVSCVGPHAWDVATASITWIALLKHRKKVRLLHDAKTRRYNLIAPTGPCASCDSVRSDRIGSPESLISYVKTGPPVTGDPSVVK